MLHTQCKLGQQVRVNAPHDRRHGTTGRVIKVNSVNVKVQLDAGGVLVVNPQYLDLASDAAPAPQLPGLVETLPLRAVVPVIGAIVTVKSDRAGLVGPHVVIGEGTSRGQSVAKIVKLGGDDNRFWRVVPSALTVVENFKLDIL